MSMVLSKRWARPACALAFALVIGTASAAYASSGSGSGASAAASSVPAAIGHPTKAALCKKPSYKIGYEVYAEGQQFADLVTNNIKTLAKKLGCVTLITLTDNRDGPTAIGNVQLMINQGIQGLLNFQVIATAQVGIANLTAAAHIPSEASGGPDQPGAPTVGINHTTAGLDGGMELGKAALKQYPKQKQPYLIYGVEPVGGPAQIQDGEGMVAGVKKYFPSLPSSHYIEVPEDGTAPVTYSGTLSALSLVPANGLVLFTGTNSDTTNAMYQAAVDRHLQNYLLEDDSGASLGLLNVCRYKQYVGSVDFRPETWGNYMLPAVMEEINGVTLPATVDIPPVVYTKQTDPLCKKKAK
jgi:ABC-type sugar transport system substrate-binding protein